MKLKTVFIILNIMRSSMIILLSKHPLYGQWWDVHDSSAYRGLVEKSKGKRSSGRSKHRQ
jgi:hypothetical protein